MRWDELGPAGRVLLTLGPGFCLFVFALVCTTDARFERAATPLFLVAAVVQPTGHTGRMCRNTAVAANPEHAVLFMSLVMLVQQGCTFWARRRTVLAFTTIVFGADVAFVALDLLGANCNLTGVTMGVSLLCVGWSLSQSVHRPMAGLVYFVGGVDLLRRPTTGYGAGRSRCSSSALPAGWSCVAAVARSRSLLVVGTAALVGYIADFIYQHFADNLGAPLALMAIGFAFLGLGAAAVRINAQ